MRRFVGIALLASLLAAPANADAISRADATRVAKKALKQQLRADSVRLHVLRKRVKPGAVVGQGARPAKRKKVERRSWLVWLDQAPQAGFVHPSVLLLVDDQTGQITRRVGFSWWPELDGKRLFVKPVRSSARPAVVPGFANDCIVTIGDRTDPYFVRGMAAMSQLGARHGMPVAAAQGVEDLGRKIDELAARNPECTDVLIYIAGHGFAPRGTNMPLDGGGEAAESENANVLIKYNAGGGNVKQEELGVEALRRIMRNRAQLTFKLVVESCFSGRWTVAMAEPNLRITVTSSRASEVTFLAVTDPRPGHQKGGKLEFTGGEQGDPQGADEPPPFTEGVIDAIDAWAASAEERAKGEELGKALAYAGVHREGDQARQLGWQSGRTDDRTGERPHAGPPTASVDVTRLDDGRFRVAVTANRRILDGTNIRTVPGFQFSGATDVEQCRDADVGTTQITCTDTKEGTTIVFIHPLSPTPAPGQKYGVLDVVLPTGTIQLDLFAP